MTEAPSTASDMASIVDPFTVAHKEDIQRAGDAAKTSDVLFVKSNHVLNPR